MDQDFPQTPQAARRPPKPLPWAPVRGASSTNRPLPPNNDHGLNDLNYDKDELLPRTPQAARRPLKPQPWAPVRGASNYTQRPHRRNKEGLKAKTINFDDDGQNSKQSKLIAIPTSNESRIRSASLSSSPYVKVTRVM